MCLKVRVYLKTIVCGEVFRLLIDTLVSDLSVLAWCGLNSSQVFATSSELTVAIFVHTCTGDNKRDRLAVQNSCESIRSFIRSTQCTCCRKIFKLTAIHGFDQNALIRNARRAFNSIAIRSEFAGIP
jgi:hypothetical protein